MSRTKDDAKLYNHWVNMKSKKRYPFELAWYNWDVFKKDVGDGYGSGLSLVPLDMDKPMGSDNFKWILKRLPVQITRDTPINQLDKHTGALIKRWESAEKVTKHLNIRVSYLSRVCRGEYRTCRGFRWEVAEDLNE